MPDYPRVIGVLYDLITGAKIGRFKTHDQTIAFGDLVVVPTKTRHGMTVVKVVDDYPSSAFAMDDIKEWVVCKVDTTEYDRIMQIERIREASPSATYLESLAEMSEMLSGSPRPISQGSP